MMQPKLVLRLVDFEGKARQAGTQYSTEQF